MEWSQIISKCGIYNLQKDIMRIFVSCSLNAIYYNQSKLQVSISWNGGMLLYLLSITKQLNFIITSICHMFWRLEKNTLFLVSLSWWYWCIARKLSILYFIIFYVVIIFLAIQFHFFSSASLMYLPIQGITLLEIKCFLHKSLICHNARYKIFGRS